MFTTRVFGKKAYEGWLLDLIGAARENNLYVLVFDAVGVFDWGLWAWRKREQVPEWYGEPDEIEVPEDAVAETNDERILFRTGVRDRQILGQPEAPLCMDCGKEKATHHYNGDYLCLKCFRKEYWGEVGTWEGFVPNAAQEALYHI
jgi:hypothetical protein